MRQRRRHFYILFFVLLAIACKGENDQFTESIEKVLFLNTETIYKSEINRVKVNYQAHDGTLIYHFWKMEKFDENGTLFLHLYPKDSSLLPVSRVAHGFINRNISKKQLATYDSINFYLAVKLPKNKLARIVTGQHKKGRRNWSAELVKINDLAKNPRSYQDRERIVVENALRTAENPNNKKPNLKNQFALNVFRLKANNEQGINDNDFSLVIGNPKSFLLKKSHYETQTEKLYVKTIEGEFIDKKYQSFDVGEFEFLVFDLDPENELPELRIGNLHIKHVIR